MHFILRFFPNFYFIYNNNKTLIPKFLGWLWILNKLIKVGHVYYFPSFYSIQKHTFSLRIGSSSDKRVKTGGLVQILVGCQFWQGAVWLVANGYGFIVDEVGVALGWIGWLSCCWCDGGCSMAVGFLSYSFCFGFF